VQARLVADVLQVKHGNAVLRCQLLRDQKKDLRKADLFFPFDKAITAGEKLEALLLSKLKLRRFY
jgi:hypothetical protein